MPRTRYDMPSHRELRVLLSGSAETEGVTLERVGDILGCSPATASRRMKSPGTLTLDELVKLGRSLHIPIEDLRNAAVKY